MLVADVQCPQVDGLVSTIIPVCNRPAMLVEAVESVLRQNYRPIEIVIVNDGSTDDTEMVAANLASRSSSKVKVIHQANAGPGAAREVGRRIAKGEFIQYLDSDDLLLPSKFQLQVAALREHSHCGVAYGKTLFCNVGESPRPISLKRTGERIETMFPAFLQSRWWSTSTPLYRRSLTDVAGPWTKLRNEEDWEYDCRIAALGPKLCYVPVPVSITRFHLQKISLNSSKDPVKLRDRAEAHRLIYKHAQSAKIDRETPEMQHYARELFLLARQCGAAGLRGDSETLFGLARTASGQERGAGWDFKLYRGLATTMGWKRAGILACWRDKVLG